MIRKNGDLMWFIIKYFCITEDQAKEFAIQGKIAVEGHPITVEDLFDYPKFENENGRSAVKLIYPNGQEEEWIY